MYYYELLFENGQVGCIETDHYINPGDIATAHQNDTDGNQILISGRVSQTLEFINID